MTGLHLEVKMNPHIVDELFVGAEYRTSVWIADKALKKLKKFVQRGEGAKFLKKLKHYATAGFPGFEGREMPIRHEWDAVYRVAHSALLFRLIGFYEGDDRTRFIAIDAFEKSGQALTASERNRIDEVARVKRDQLWKRRER